jgi:hypothetical protein
VKGPGEYSFHFACTTYYLDTWQKKGEKTQVLLLMSEIQLLIKIYLNMYNTDLRWVFWRKGTQFYENLSQTKFLTVMTGLRSKDHSTRRTYEVGKMENEESFI